jgi:hypothetical protein
LPSRSRPWAPLSACCRWSTAGWKPSTAKPFRHAFSEDDDARGQRGGDAGARGGQPQGGFADREQNLTWSDELGDDNRIVAGRWWRPEDLGKPLVSLATEFQERLGLKLGDTLGFDVAGEPLVVTVASFREVKWDSFRPNFFMCFHLVRLTARLAPT